MTTAAEDRAAIVAAIQVAAENDLIRLGAFVDANEPSFSILAANLGKLAGQLSNPHHADRLLVIQASIEQALNDFNTVLSLNEVARTDSKE